MSYDRPPTYDKPKGLLRNLKQKRIRPKSAFLRRIEEQQKKAADEARANSAGAGRQSRSVAAATETGMIRAITIVAQADGHFDVHQGESFANGLIFDEMLAEVACLTIGVNSRYMISPDTHLARIELRQKRRKEREQP